MNTDMKLLPLVYIFSLFISQLSYILSTVFTLLCAYFIFISQASNYSETAAL